MVGKNIERKMAMMNCRKFLKKSLCGKLKTTDKQNKLKPYLLLCFFLPSILCFAQIKDLKVGDKWPYDYSYIRDADNPKNPNDPFQGHDFHYNEGLAKVSFNDKIGFIDSSKTIQIPLIYDHNHWANKFSNSRSVVLKDNKWGVIDNKGSTFFPFIYDEIKRFGNLYYVRIDYEWAYLDSAGTTLLPFREYKHTYIMTKEEILTLAEEYRQKDSLESSVPISKEKAISIAKSKNHYYAIDAVFGPVIELNILSNEWIISSTLHKGTTKKGKCAHTNGCIVLLNSVIAIDSNTGKVKRKSKEEELIPCYE